MGRPARAATVRHTETSTPPAPPPPFHRGLCSVDEYQCDFGSVLDGMLTDARRNAASHNVANVVFRKSEDAAFAAVGRCNFVNSYIVLQHIPVKRGMAYIDRLLDIVAPNGVAVLHFSVSRRMGFARNSLYLAKQYIPGVLASVNLARGRRYDEPLMQMNSYSLPDVIALAESKSFGPALVSTENHFGVLTASIMCQRV